MHAKIVVLPGDGIGPEVTAAAVAVLRAVAARYGHDFDFSEHLIGGAAIDATGSALPDATLAAARSADAILLGAVGGPQWSDPGAKVRPEQGLLAIRKALGLYANLRPVKPHAATLGASPIKPHLLQGVDLIVVRELTGGIYFGSPRFIEDVPTGGKRAVDTQVYTTAEIERVARVAFELARGRRNKVTSAEKSNVMDSGLLWRQVVTDLHARDYADVELEHILADNAAMQIVKNPKQFDVMVTDNLFGDILSDISAQLTGSLGMLPSAALGEAGKPGLYEPIHGSAPDIAGQGIANPLAAILSFEMALRWSLDQAEAADKLYAAVIKALDSGARTRDLGGALTTAQMGDAVIAAL